jgi:diguanylate cyclase (GGDEF)-like protein/PAS domain S-box-containing protein
MDARQRAAIVAAVPLGASLLAIAVAGLALVGWMLDLPVLHSVRRSFVAMNPATAAAIALAGLSLLLLRRSAAPPSAPRRRAGIAAGLAVAAIGALRLTGSPLGYPPVDLWLFRGSLASGPGPPVHRMVAGTAICLILLGVGLAFTDRHPSRARLGSIPWAVALVTTAAVGLAMLISYVYLGSTLLPGAASGMAANTAACLLALACGALASRPDRGFLAILAGGGEEGRLARRLLFATTAVPLVLGWLRLVGQGWGLYRAEVGVALLAVATVVLLGLVVWAAVAALARAEAERRSAAEALGASERRYRELVESSAAFLCTHDAQGVLLSVNAAAAEALGYRSQEMVGRRLTDFMAPAARELFGEYLAVLRERGRHEGLLGIRTRAGEERIWLYSQRWTEEPGGPPFALGHALDVTERHRTEREIAFQAFHDPLTGVANRALFEDRLKQAVARASRHRERCAVFYLDLDGFKPINDTYGHPVGDRVLEEIAARLSESVRKVDTVARLGGDEFCLLISDLRRPADALRLGESILAKVARPFTQGSLTLHGITACLGISLYPESGETPEALIAGADSALLLAKAAGRGRLHLR